MSVVGSKKEVNDSTLERRVLGSRKAQASVHVAGRG